MIFYQKCQEDQYLTQNKDLAFARTQKQDYTEIVIIF